jgi:hypothetical protein
MAEQVAHRVKRNARHNQARSKIMAEVMPAEVCEFRRRAQTVPCLNALERLTVDIRENVAFMSLRFLRDQHGQQVAIDRDMALLTRFRCFIRYHDDGPL